MYAFSHNKPGHCIRKVSQCITMKYTGVYVYVDASGIPFNNNEDDNEEDSVVTFRRQCFKRKLTVWSADWYLHKGFMMSIMITGKIIF